MERAEERTPPVRGPLVKRPAAQRRMTKRERQRRAHRRRQVQLGGLAVATIAVVVAAVVILAPGGGGGLNTALHQHPNIEIYIQGAKVTVPANIGIDPNLWNDHSFDDNNVMAGMSPMSPLHTHDSSGVIHLEMNKWHLCTLGDFFNVWGQPFDRDKVMSFGGAVTMTVNGQPNDQYRDLALQDGQRIVIRAG